MHEWIKNEWEKNTLVSGVDTFYKGLGNLYFRLYVPRDKNKGYYVGAFIERKRISIKLITKLKCSHNN